MQRVIIVDLGNLRENRPGRARRERRTIRGRARTVAFADWAYIEEAVGELAVAAPEAVIYLIADKSMRYDFAERGRGMRIFDRNRQLSCEDFWHMYVMPSRQELAAWRQDNDTESGVEADELILFLAAELDGIVISGDFYREPRYQRLLERFGHRVFWPSKMLDDSGWCFASSMEIRDIEASRRHERMQSLQQLQDVISAAPALNAEQRRLIKNSICEEPGLIDRFWLEYLSEYDRQRGVIQPPPVSPPPAVTAGPKQQEPKPAKTPSSSRSLVQVFGEQLGILPPTDDGVPEERKIPIIFACHPLSLTSSEGSVVQLVGRLRSDGSTNYLEWYPGDQKVRIHHGFDAAHPSSQGFLGVTGRLSTRNGQFVLEKLGSAAPKSYSFEELLDALSDGDLGDTSISNRRWHLPQLPRISRKKQVNTTTLAPFEPLRPKAPPPGRAVSAPTTVGVRPPMPDIPPLPAPPRVSSRLKVLIALGVAALAGMFSLVVTRL